jgi:hypothetical protein
MTIKRQYSLPNCTLILEGVGEDDLSLVRPLLTSVFNAECHFAGYQTPLLGGREFLDSLVQSVSEYAQGFLSGIPHTSDPSGKPNLVKIERVDTDVHRLSVYSQASNHHHTTDTTNDPVAIELQTVQLFDLVEAVDQLCADAQTLPDLPLNLVPLPKRRVAAQEPIAKRTLPAVVGISGLAVAAGLLFLVPTPPVRRPEPAANQSSSETTTPTTPVASSPPTPPTGATPASPTLAGASATAASPTPATTVAASPDVSPSAIATPTATPTPEATASPTPGSPDLNTALAAPEITDPDQVDRLQQQLRDKLDESWKTRPTFNEDLIFRVSVTTDGDIVGYSYTNGIAAEHANETPLPGLLYTPTNTAQSEPIAQFRVVFTPAGAVQVSPWNGKPSAESSPTPTP